VVDPPGFYTTRWDVNASMAKLYETDNDGAETKEVGTNEELLAG
jgi:hypothetical protein